MIKVNLVPVEILNKAEQKQRLIQICVAGIFFVVCGVGATMAHWAHVRSLQRLYARDQIKFKELSVIVAKVEEREKTAAMLRVRLGVITDLLRSRSFYPVFMSDFVRSVPPGVRVRTLGTNGPIGGPLKLNIAAEARTHEDIATWARFLERTGVFSAVELGSVSVNGSDTKMYNFTLSAIYTAKLE